MQNLGKKIIILFMITVQMLYAAKDDFKFEILSDKSSAYVGENIKITFKFQYKIDKKIAEANFNPPRFHNFWIKPSKKVPNTIHKGYMVYTLDYIVSPQVAGDLKIEPARMDIGILTKKQKNMLQLERVKYKTIFSNALNIKAKALPKGISLFGDFKIQSSIDKNITKPNQPINLTINVKGTGNIEDISAFKLDIKDAMVYADKPKYAVHFKRGKNEGTMQQKFAIVADKNFTIPISSLTFFDNQSKTIKKIQTTPIFVQVTSKHKQTAFPHLEKESHQDVTVKNNSVNWLLLIGAFILGSLVTLAFQKKGLFHTKTKQNSIEHEIQKAKSDKALLKLLLPYANRTEELDKIIKKLEENLYENKKHTIHRKSLSKDFTQYVTIRKDDANILT